MQPITLYQLCKTVQSTLEENLEVSYWVIAEIGEIRVNQKGHCYLDLVEKEQDKLIAKQRANIWAYDFYNLNSMFRSITGQPLKSGMKILAKVGVQYHEIYGLSLHVRDLDPNFTLGERARQRQAVIDKLKNQGVFHSNKQLPLPLVPQRVAIVSSRTAAGYGDFIDQLLNNPYQYAFKVKLFKTMMQGEEAIDSVVKSISQVTDEIEDFDLLVVIRGGGSQVDLDCFDSYQVASAVAECPLPVITGIGHQRDDTITDMVAHTKMKTPTAVAEFLVNGMEAFDQQLAYQFDQMQSKAVALLNDQQSSLLLLLNKLEYNARKVVADRLHQLEIMNERILASTRGAIREQEHLLSIYRDAIINSSKNKLRSEMQKIDSLETNLNMADPANVLKRGYSITYLNGKLIKTDTDIIEGDKIETKFANRTLSSKVVDVNNEIEKNL